MNNLTLFLVQIIGIYALISGLSGLLYPARLQKAMNEMQKSYVLPYFDGGFALIAGLFIVLIHNVWVGGPASLVSLIGWLAVIEGVVMLLLPQKTIASIAEKFSSKNFALAMSILSLIVGAYFVYNGFFL